MPDERKTSPLSSDDDGQATLVDATWAEDREQATVIVDDGAASRGGEREEATVIVDDGAESRAELRDAGGTTTVIVPDDDPPRARSLASRTPRRTLWWALFAAGVAMVALSVVFALLLRALLARDGGAAAEGAPVLEPSGALPAGAPLQAAATCSYQPGRGGQGTLTIVCDVTNPRAAAARVSVVPVVFRGEVAERVHHEEVTVEAGQRVQRRFELRGRSDADVGSGCSCEVLDVR